MASSPTAVSKAPVAQFLVIPMKDSVELDIAKAEIANNPGEATTKAHTMIMADELEHPVVIFQATQMIGLTKRPEVVWQPRGSA